MMSLTNGKVDKVLDAARKLLPPDNSEWEAKVAAEHAALHKAFEDFVKAIAEEDEELAVQLLDKTMEVIETKDRENVFIEWLWWIARGLGKVPERMPRVWLEEMLRLADREGWCCPRVRCLNCHLLIPDQIMPVTTACLACGGPVEWGQFGIGAIFPSDREKAGQEA